MSKPPRIVDDSRVDPASTRTSRKAIASFVLAVVGLIGILWLGFLFLFGSVIMFLFGFLDRGGPETALLVAILFWGSCLAVIVLGKKARDDIRTSSGQLRGHGLARAGIVLAISNGVLALAIPVVEWHRQGPQFPPRLAVSHMRTDMRSLATAIEAYLVDNMIYPAYGVGANGPGGTQTYNCRVASRAGIEPHRRNWYYEQRRFGPICWYKRVPYESNHPADLPSFALNSQAPGQRFQTLTTPIAYITSYPTDWLSPIKGATFVYWSVIPGQPDPSGKIFGRDSPIGGVGWILVSPGPDLKYDIVPDDWDAYDPSVPQPSKRLLAGTNKKGRAFTYDPTNGTISDGDIWRVKQ